MNNLVEMIVAADHMGDAHIPVIHHHAEIVGRRSVGAGDDQVVHFAILKAHRTVNQVFHHRFAVVRAAEADHRRNPLRRRRALPATAVIARFLAALALILAHGLHFFPTAIAMVGRSRRQHLRGQGALLVILAQALDVLPNCEASARS